MNKNFWSRKKVLITGNTGFKGSWLSLWLQELKADVLGYSLCPMSSPNLYNIIQLDQSMNTVFSDIRDFETLFATASGFEPDIILHMAAQPLVRYSYSHPRETYEVNVMGTVNVLECARQIPSVKAVVNVTTDKCYENQNWHWGYRENDSLGGHDPYSNSKACSELVTSSYRNSFFNLVNTTQNLVGIASARAGNVVGGGDWSNDRLIPDVFRAISENKPIVIRQPMSTRPWQHVLEPLAGYLKLAEKLYEQGVEYAGPWNFGPSDESNISVNDVLTLIAKMWDGLDVILDDTGATKMYETTFLKLDSSKAKSKLRWFNVWDVDTALHHTVDWYKAFLGSADMRSHSLSQINLYNSGSNRD